MPDMDHSQTIAALTRAEEQYRHDLTDDSPGPPSRVQRWTCNKCGDAILRYQGNVYGSALDAPCQAAEFPYVSPAVIAAETVVPGP